jgi:hypothetical protein
MILDRRTDVIMMIDAIAIDRFSEAFGAAAAWMLGMRRFRMKKKQGP